MRTYFTLGRPFFGTLQHISRPVVWLPTTGADLRSWAKAAIRPPIRSCFFNQEDRSPVEWLGTQTFRHDAHRIPGRASSVPPSGTGFGRRWRGFLRVVRLGQPAVTVQLRLARSICLAISTPTAPGNLVTFSQPTRPPPSRSAIAGVGRWVYAGHSFG
jgi:hypothetical protein